MCTQRMTCVAAVCLLILCFPRTFRAQTTFATITGTVTDPSGEVLTDVQSLPRISRPVRKHQPNRMMPASSCWLLSRRERTRCEPNTPASRNL